MGSRIFLVVVGFREDYVRRRVHHLRPPPSGEAGSQRRGDLGQRPAVSPEQKAAFLKENSGETPDGQSEHKHQHGQRRTLPAVAAGQAEVGPRRSKLNHSSSRPNDSGLSHSHLSSPRTGYPAAGRDSQRLYAGQRSLNRQPPHPRHPPGQRTQWSPLLWVRYLPVVSPGQLDVARRYGQRTQLHRLRYDGRVAQANRFQPRLWPWRISCP